MIYGSNNPLYIELNKIITSIKKNCDGIICKEHHNVGWVCFEIEYENYHLHIKIYDDGLIQLYFDKVFNVEKEGKDNVIIELNRIFRILRGWQNEH